jgi:sentrin-specific protease 7
MLTLGLEGNREGGDSAKLGKADEEVRTLKASSKRGKKAGPGMRKCSVDAYACPHFQLRHYLILTRKRVYRPVIITLDSLNASHSDTIRNLKEYLVMEAKDKKNVELQIGDVSGMTAKGIPMQDNYCDCGLYLLGYMEKFLQNPRQLANQLLQREPLQDEDWPKMKPRNMRENIRNLLMQLSKEQFLASKEAKKEAAKRSGKYHAKASSAAGDAASPARTVASDGGAAALESAWTDTSSDVSIIEETPRPASANSRRAEPPSSPRPASASSVRAEPPSSPPGRGASPTIQRPSYGRVSDDLEEAPAADAAEPGGQIGNDSVIVIESGPSQ